jgi:hypothetical protein
MQVTEGGCLCRAIRYRFAGLPLSSIICHCATCRKANASPTVAWLTIDRAQFQFLAGSPQYFQSSHDVVRRFCGRCGSQLTYENAGSPNTIDVTTASLYEPNSFAPTMEVWLEHRLEWQVANLNLGQFRHGTDEE